MENRIESKNIRNNTKEECKQIQSNVTLNKDRGDF